MYTFANDIILWKANKNIKNLQKEINKVSIMNDALA
jgi:hypothetical protein